MTELDRASLDRLLPATAGSADWDDVLGRARLGRARGRRLVVLGAVALVAAVTASGFAMHALISDRGFIGLPPPGATPSTPSTVKVVATYWVATPESMSNPRRVMAWLYADGRLVWKRENEPTKPRPPEAANRWSSGLIEQRLTRAGVERLRSEIVATGLLGRNLVLDDEPCANWIEARNGRRLVRLGFTSAYCPSIPKGAQRATSDQERAVEELKVKLSDPTAWLPAGAWKQRELRAFVPSRFVIGMESEELALLPVRARNALRGLTWSEGTYGAATEVTTKDARRLAKTLESAGLTKIRGAFILRYRFVSPGSGEAVEISFGPLLPHGEEPGYGG